MQQNTVFISYRRSLSKHLARSIYQDLRINGWDVFLDVNTIDSGDFDRIILNQIGARAHFILLLSPGSLERCANSGDWVLREIQEAVRLKRNIIPVIEEGADFSRELAYLPAELGTVISKKNALPLNHFYFEAGMAMLRTRFLKSPEYVAITEASPAERAEVQRRLTAVDGDAPAPSTTEPMSLSLMPAPFEWIEIPGGHGTMNAERGETLSIPTERYWISKYPVTNVQFRKFIEASGYRTERWWTKDGLDWKKSVEYVKESEGGFFDTNPLKGPLYWYDSKWNDDTQPVVGVNWYEAVAFCLWLSEATGENIMLPTEEQWQYAAQGDDGRRFPWGNQWDSSKCRNSVDVGDRRSGTTSYVTLYEGKGDSPFGVVDMAGNVWEWCLTDYSNKTNDVTSSANRRVLRGGSWWNDHFANYLCGFRNRDDPKDRENYWGFRLVRT